ncbi:RDD family protein [Sinomonas sp. JGH33]|uniref:RDD family protein n=1 Tax=Sinomonas terricola TaxID=3110330 RepID=A0ABU5T4V7_9MICC|nr:RDD family protein [Sinomonas sp. JGH33]MEA5454697.1 RDD family protein [Sinomonas sp. JGH33]
MAQLQLVDASTGKRAVAKLVDLAILTAVELVPFGFGAASLGSLSGSRYPTASDEAALLAAFIWFALAVALGLAVGIVLWGWEARTGSTPGNSLVGIRTANLEGRAPGWGAVFIRCLVFGLVCLIPVAGLVLALISNLFDANGQRQGWHDKAARTLAFDVRAGRNPVTTGGIEGPEAFAPPEALPPVRPVASPVAAPPAAAPLVAPAPAAHALAVPAPPQAFAPAPTPRAPSSFAAPAAHGSAYDDELDATRLARPGGRGGDIVLSFSDGRRLTLRGPVLVGRNPAAYDGETFQQLVSIDDPGRSVSKTHLTVWAEHGRVWVQDRKSTNGTTVVREDGSASDLEPSLPLEVAAGDVVHFGDCFFSVGISREARA